MPQMANITVKKADGTTDIVYTALSPSAGEGVAAIWRQNANAIPLHRPTVTLATRNNGPKNGRVFRLGGRFPIVQTVGGAETVVATFPIELTGTLPLNGDTAQTKEAIYQFGNLIVAALVRASLEDGYAPT